MTFVLIREMLSVSCRSLVYPPVPVRLHRGEAALYRFLDKIDSLLCLQGTGEHLPYCEGSKQLFSFMARGCFIRGSGVP